MAATFFILALSIARAAALPHLWREVEFWEWSTGGCGTGGCGGDGGGSFDDWNEHGVGFIKSIYARGDRRLDHFKPTYAEPFQKETEHGTHHILGSDRTFPLNYPHEWITGIEIRSGKAVDGFKVWTNLGRTSEWVGDYGGSSHWYYAPENYMITAFKGKSGNHMDRLGFYIGPSPTFCDKIEETTGYWKPKTYTSENQTITVFRGTTHGYTTTTTEEWSQKVTEKVSLGFKWGKKDSSGGALNIEVSAEQAYSIATTYSETFSETYSEQKEVTFPAGQVWAWSFDVNDACGGSNTETDNWVSTPNLDAYPCCPSGKFADPTNVLGECTDPALSYCS